MDKTDRQIIAALQQNGRLTNQELSEKVNLSPSPCLRRLRLLEESGVIKGYSAIVDEKAYGLPITAFVRVRLQQHTRELVKNFESSIRDIDIILDCYMLTGDADYLLRVLVESLEGYEHFIRRRLHMIDGIASIDTSFAYGVVKRTALFPDMGN